MSACASKAAPAIGGRSTDSVRKPSSRRAAAAASTARRAAGAGSPQGWWPITPTTTVSLAPAASVSERPLSACTHQAASATRRANTPTVSSDQEKHLSPCLGSHSAVGM